MVGRAGREERLASPARLAVEAAAATQPLFLLGERKAMMVRITPQLREMEDPAMERRMSGVREGASWRVHLHSERQIRLRSMAWKAAIRASPPTMRPARLFHTLLLNRSHRVSSPLVSIPNISLIGGSSL